jgi:tRNA(His) 5'-end guanylyltransferase
MSKDSLGDRMKGYEQAEAGRQLMPLLPICVRIDGKCFSNFTRDLRRPFDERLHEAMCYTTQRLVEDTGAKIGYTQSDEISLVIYSDDRDSQVFFDGKIQKITSVIASMATFYFAQGLAKFLPEKSGQIALFDCRAWNVPNKEEAVNTVLWREIDASKNSVSMAARHYFSHKAIHGKSGSEMQEMLFSQHGVNWNDYPSAFKRGTYIRRQKRLIKFSADELERLPAKHEARNNPNLMVERSVVEAIQMPPITRVMNRLAVVFDGADPICESADVLVRSVENMLSAGDVSGAREVCAQNKGHAGLDKIALVIAPPTCRVVKNEKTE